MGCTDHNLVVTVRKAKVSKSGPKIDYSRLMKTFNEETFIEDVKNTVYAGSRY